MMTDIILPDGFDRGEVLFPGETEQAVQAAEEAEQAAEEAEQAAPDPIEAQNEEAAAKAPVRGVSGGTSPATEEKSLFEQGFDAASRW